MKLAGAVAGVVTIARVVAIVMVVVSGLGIVISPWVDPPDIEIGFEVPAALRFDPDRQPTAIPPGSAERVHLDEVNGSLKFSPRNRVLVGVSAAALLVWSALLVWVLSQVQGLFRTLRAGRPFAPANARRIRRVGYAVIGAELVRAVIAYLGTRYAMTNFVVSGVQFETRFHIDLFVIFCGLMILVIAEAFREGARLSEEQSLTI
jgi:hypothetical protein